VPTANAPRITSALCSDTTSGTAVSTSRGRWCSQLGNYDADQRMVTLQRHGGGEVLTGREVAVLWGDLGWCASCWFQGPNRLGQPFQQVPLFA
jgi:hypothetical protein